MVIRVTVDSEATISAPAIPPEEGNQPMKRTRHRNGALRKRCGCPRKRWAKCDHRWHLNFKPKRGPLAGTAFRLSLDREIGEPITSRSDAETAATNIRAAILAGTFRAATEPKAEPATALMFRGFAKIWK